MTTGQASRAAVMAVVESGSTGEPSGASLEVLGAARTLANGLGRDLAVAFIAPRGAPEAAAPARARADRAYQVAWDTGNGIVDDAMVEAAWLAVDTERPCAVLFADTLAARAIAARVAVRLDADLVVGCALLRVRDGAVQLGRACLSGKAFAHLEWDRARSAVITVAAGAFPAPPAAANDPGVAWLEAPAGPASSVRVLGEIAPAPDAMGVTEADVVIAGGAGVGGAEGFEQLTELARRLGGTVAASRVAVDKGWMPSSRQVGLTGKTVSPRLYLAVGISGAPQHIAGIRAAGKVVAINQDPRAPIFRVADLAVVGDLHEVVPALLQRLAPSGAPTPEEVTP